VGDICWGLIDAFSGAGLAFMSFLACIPGLLPAVIVGALLVAPLVIPPVVVGGAVWLVYRTLLLGARLTARGAALIAGNSSRSRQRRPGMREAGSGDSRRLVTPSMGAGSGSRSASGSA
jgi:hypothetical protein